MPRKAKKAPEMKEMRVTLKGGKASKAPARKKAVKSMSFHQWVAHYVKMSGGNPV